MGFAMRSAPSAKEPRFEYMPKIGMDLGTKYTRVGFWYAGDIVLVPNESNKLSTPTCVAFSGHDVLVGETAVEQAERNPKNTIMAPQHLIGCKYSSPSVKWYQNRWGTCLVAGSDGGARFKIDFKGKEVLMSPEEVLAYLLRHLRQRTEAYVRRSVVDVVLAVPSLYGKMQRRALTDVFRQVRLNVVEMVRAPTAAGLGYAAANREEHARTFLVCDMGGALFDMAVLSMSDDGTLTERAITTEHVDHEASLMRYCQSSMPAGRRSRGGTLRLRQACESTKCILSSSTEASVEMVTQPEPAGSPRLTDVRISQTLFETMCRQDVYEWLDAINYCIEDVGLEKSDIDAIIMVGGSSRIPVFRRGLKQFFHGQNICNVPRPDHAVVLGTAVYAGILSARKDGDAPAPCTDEVLRAIKHFRVAPLTSFAERTLLDVDVPFQPFLGFQPFGGSAACGHDAAPMGAAAVAETPSTDYGAETWIYDHDPTCSRSPSIDDSCTAVSCAYPAIRMASGSHWAAGYGAGIADVGDGSTCRLGGFGPPRCKGPKEPSFMPSCSTGCGEEPSFMPSCSTGCGEELEASMFGVSRIRQPRRDDPKEPSFAPQRSASCDERCNRLKPPLCWYPKEPSG